ncbi:MAG: Wadjet anti-phage system protein JetD domain-containing protein [Clostridiaceae bacterium]
MDCSVIIGRSEVHELPDKKYKLIWSKKYENYRFATYRIVSGKKYNDVNEIVNKPHGYKATIYKMLEFLSKKDKYRWNTFQKKFNLDNSFKDLITILLNAGIIEILEKNSKPAKREEWNMIEIALDSRAINDTKILCSSEEPFEVWKSKLIKEVQVILYGVKNSDSEIDKVIESCIQEGINKLNGIDNEFPCGISSRKKYRSFLLTIAYFKQTLYYNKSTPLRTISSNIWDDSKVLDKYIDDISSYVGFPIQDLGITTHPEIVWLFGAGEYILNSLYTTSLMAAKPVILSEETIEESKFVASENLKYIIIVENLTVFMTLLQKEYYKRFDTIVIWSHGYWSSNHKQILLDIFSSSNEEISIYIWCDIDIDGLLIASNIYNWVINYRNKVKFLLMDNETYNLCESKRNLTERESGLINSDNINEYFISLLEDIKRKAITVEQEKLLDNFEYVKSKLP